MVSRDKIVMLTASCLALMGVAGCGSGSSDNEVRASSGYDCSQPNSDTMTDVKLAGMPILSNSAIFAAIDAGIFQKNGLKPTVEMVASGPAAIAGLMGGSVDFAFAPTVNLVQAVDQGQPLRGVAPFAGVEPGFSDKMAAGRKGYESGINALLVQGNSGLGSAKDLEGKTVAITDAAFSKVLVSTWIRAHGGDPAKVRFVILAPPDAYAALKAGRVDAAHGVEPYIQGFEQAGIKNLGWLEVENFKQGAPMTFMVAKVGYINAHPDTVARFNCAISGAAEYGNQHPAELRAATAKQQKVAPSAFDGQLVPWFFPKLDKPGVDAVQEAMVQTGLLKNPLPLQDFLAPAVVSNADVR
jgi:NitT/TauT family transport system substrate-binding protein